MKESITRRLVLSILVLASISPFAAFSATRCGGTERWAVKVGTDDAASEIDTANPLVISIQDINAIPDPRSNLKGKDAPRINLEKRVHEVKGTLRMFKYETDDDYHLVITDSSLKYSKGGKASKGKETGTSFIAEIADPKCYMGQKGDIKKRSQWPERLREARDQFELRFDREDQDRELNVPVTIIGVAFFDRDHGQVGRARNGFELHPVLSITFDDEATVAPASASASGVDQDLLVNSGFEDGDKGWKASSGVIEIDGYPDPSRGNAKAVLGDLGERGQSFLYQQVKVPASASSVKLAYRLRVKTAEPASSNKPSDTMSVQVRDASGKWLKTVARYSNLDRSSKYKSYSLNLVGHKGKTIRIHFQSQENSDRATAFLLDDVELKVR